MKGKTILTFAAGTALGTFLTVKAVPYIVAITLERQGKECRVRMRDTENDKVESIDTYYTWSNKSGNTLIMIRKDCVPNESEQTAETNEQGAPGQ